MATGLSVMVMLVALTFLQFTSNDVARITERTHSTEAGRLAMERVMLELHSSCVAPGVAPILEGSTESRLRFLSGYGREASLTSIEAHEVLFSPAAEAGAGSILERSWPATLVASSDPPRYAYNEAQAPSSTRTLLAGVRTSQAEGGGGGTLPVFRYYRYYREGDPSAAIGQLDPEALSGVLAGEARYVAKVTVTFTVAPPGRLPGGAYDDRPAPFEDSAILRLAPPSESANTPNLPCAPST